MVSHEGPGVSPAVDRLELRDRLHDRQQPQVVARHVGDCPRDDLDLSDRGKFVHQQQALKLQCRVILGQLLRVEAHELREHEVHE